MDILYSFMAMERKAFIHPYSGSGRNHTSVVVFWFSGDWKAAFPPFDGYKSVTAGKTQGVGWRLFLKDAADEALKMDFPYLQNIKKLLFGGCNESLTK